ncbi:10321_t:CDS:1 [Paraglomus brasilianum]|uniref:10321_t:CDS:1 n=1 Tax=Paraglomus brasilianum TaxID=144538 RepID=A0A9N9B6J9_9GLOM|nr:10321_t:CDS:1 [Paraglomus brasilianum]
MPNPVLPTELLSDIIRHLDDSYVSLFNCLFVNRAWCKATVPILYRSPLALYQRRSVPSTTSSQREDLAYMPIDTYLASLPASMREAFPDLKEKFPNEFKPLFNYYSYLEYLSDEALFNSVINSFDSAVVPVELKEYAGIYAALLSMFINEAKRLKKLDLVCMFRTDLLLQQSERWPIGNLGHNRGLVSLTISVPGLTDINPKAKYLQNHGQIADIILNQKRIEVIKLKIFGKVSHVIMDALLEKRNTLEFIKFVRCNFDDYPLEEWKSKLGNITLEFSRCHNIADSKTVDRPSSMIFRYPVVKN